MSHPTRMSYSKLSDDAKRRAGELVAKFGYERAAKMLGTADTTLQNLREGGCALEATCKRIERALMGDRKVA